MSGVRVAAVARSLVGARFRLHGRAAASGLDCVGLVALALERAGVMVEAPTGYALRGGDVERVTALLDARFSRSDGDTAGDILLLRSGPGQLHLAIKTDAGLVHADAGLRRVVERPGVSPWPLIGAWRADAPPMGEG